MNIPGQCFRWVLAAHECTNGSAASAQFSGEPVLHMLANERAESLACSRQNLHPFDIVPAGAPVRVEVRRSVAECNGDRGWRDPKSSDAGIPALIAVFRHMRQAID